METVIIILVCVVGFGILAFHEGKKQGYDKGLADGYEECRRNYLNIHKFINKKKNENV